jgi:type III secretory pathway lipoprotein EscJ
MLVLRIVKEIKDFTSIECCQVRLDSVSVTSAPARRSFAALVAQNIKQSESNKRMLFKSQSTSQLRRLTTSMTCWPLGKLTWTSA